MKIHLFIASLSLFATTLSAEDLFFGSVSSENKSYEFLAPKSIVAAAPKWDGISKELPLSMENAIEILQAAAKEDFGTIPPLRSIEITENYLNKVYHYRADFILPDASNLRSNYLLLFDGTVIRLTPKVK